MTQVSETKRRYTIVFEPAEEGGYVIRVPYLNITTEAETLEEGRLMAADAIAGYLECLHDDGLPIPEEPSIQAHSNGGFSWVSLIKPA